MDKELRRAIILDNYQNPYNKKEKDRKRKNNRDKKRGEKEDDDKGFNIDDI